MLPDDLANRLTPTGFAEQCAYIEIKAETLEAARAKVVAPAPPSMPTMPSVASRTPPGPARSRT